MDFASHASEGAKEGFRKWGVSESLRHHDRGHEGFSKEGFSKGGVSKLFSVMATLRILKTFPRASLWTDA